MIGNKVQLIRSSIDEMEKAEQLESGKADLLRKYLKDLDRALRAKSLKKVQKAVDQIAREFMK